jgi:subfamily B ATP-binding cassette protein MsbA
VRDLTCLYLFYPVSGYVISIGKQLKNNPPKHKKSKESFIYHRKTLGGLKVVKGYNSESYFNTFSKNQHNAFQTI